jgi:hypothetical protein
MIALSGGMAVCALTAAVALAKIAEPPAGDGVTLPALHASDATTSEPVAGGRLFEASRGDVSDLRCIGDGEVISHLDAERERYGGEMVMLADGLDQAFADAWRQEAGGEPVAISAVFAHVFGEEDAAMVDVVELDARGCALSRTLLTGDQWHFLLTQAVGVAV